MNAQVQTLITGCGGFQQAVHAVMSLSRAFRMLCSDDGERKSGKKDLFRRSIVRSHLYSLYESTFQRPGSDDTLNQLLERVKELDLGWEQEDGSFALRLSLANSLDFMSAMLSGARPDHDIKYFVAQSIRRHHQFVQSANAAHQIHALGTALNQVLERRNTGDDNAPPRPTLHIQDDLMPALREAAKTDSEMSEPIIDLFIEICFAVNYIRLSHKVCCVEVPASVIDAEFLLCRLFGLPTQIKGLDDLFGGGGIMFVDAPTPSNRPGIGGRALVTVGPFGSAKSLLALLVAVEVARKGGVSWFMPLEQSAEECLYTMESMGFRRDDSAMVIATTVREAMELLTHPVSGRGALILLRTVKETFEDFLVTFTENVALMRGYPLRLIIVDPISAMAQSPSHDNAERRGMMLSLFESVKRNGTNIWLIVEEGQAEGESPYEQKIADTVIRLFSETRYGYSQRYIEILKSRMQRETRGRHAFTIGPGKGITIYPSSAAVRSRLRKRSDRLTLGPIEFGLPSLDRIITKGSLYAGDIIVLQGPSGCSKTKVALSFLLSENWGKGKPLLVSARDSEAGVRHSLEQLSNMQRQMDAPVKTRNPGDVRITVMDGGYVKPGYILQRLEEEFTNSRLKRRPISRVVIDDIAHWEASCPYIREDETFGDTLVEMLRRHGVTAVLTCGDPRPGSDSVLQRSILDNADCMIKFERLEFRGVSQIMLRVLETRDMTHRKESFELIATPTILEVKSSSSLVQTRSDGSLSSFKVRLFLHSESEAQTQYNKSILMAIGSTLSRDVVLESENPIHISRVLSLGESSSIDELQILQLDEFQLPVADRSMVNDLYLFPNDDWKSNPWSEIIPSVGYQVRVKGGYFAVPFYENIGLLAYRNGLPQECVASWELLSQECVRWETNNAAEGECFFSFPMISSENFNVLFAEILLWLTGPFPRAKQGQQQACVLKNWLTSEASVRANLIMYRLCHRAYTAAHESGSLDLSQPAPFHVVTNARVWRHWYSTLNQMLSDISAADRADITVSTLPGDASVAGEWFLGVPRYSAAPDVALRVIQLYTSHEAEMDRLKYGIGLPVRSTFYKQQGADIASVSPFFSMDTSKLLKTIEGSFRRSSFGCYRRYASVLSTHLQSVLMLTVTDEQELERKIRTKVDGLNERLQSIQEAECSRCSIHQRGKAK